MARINTRTHRGPGARFSASSRPVPEDLRRRISAAARGNTMPTNLAVRMTVTAVIFAFLALVTLLVTGPATVTIPLAIVLVTGFAVGGVFALVDRHRSRARILGGAGLPSPAAVRRRAR